VKCGTSLSLWGYRLKAGASPREDQGSGQIIPWALPQPSKYFDPPGIWVKWAALSRKGNRSLVIWIGRRAVLKKSRATRVMCMWGVWDFLAWEPAPGPPALPWQRWLGRIYRLISTWCLRSFKIPAGSTTHPLLLWITARALGDASSHSGPWHSSGNTEGVEKPGEQLLNVLLCSLECQFKSLNGKCDFEVLLLKSPSFT
jgi:hypothetical protein